MQENFNQIEHEQGTYLTRDGFPIQKGESYYFSYTVPVRGDGVRSPLRGEVTRYKRVQVVEINYLLRQRAVSGQFIEILDNDKNTQLCYDSSLLKNMPESL